MNASGMYAISSIASERLTEYQGAECTELAPLAALNDDHGVRILNNIRILRGDSEREGPAKRRIGCVRAATTA
jgi:hypothetical protein